MTKKREKTIRRRWAAGAEIPGLTVEHLYRWRYSGVSGGGGGGCRRTLASAIVTAAAAADG